VLSPQKLLPERTTFPAPLPNVDNAVVSKAGNSAEIAFRNNKGVSITFPLLLGNYTLTPATGTTCNNPVMSGTYNGAAITPATVIPNGASFLLKWTCAGVTAANVGDKFGADISFNYINTDTTQQLTATGSIDGKYGS